MDIKSGDIINLNMFGEEEYNEHELYYVFGKENDKYFLLSVRYGGKKNGQRHLVLRDEDIRVIFYTKKDLERNKAKILDIENFKGFKQIKFKTEEGWTKWFNDTPYGDDIKEAKEWIKHEGETILDRKERII